MELKWPKIVLLFIFCACSHQRENKDLVTSAKYYFEKGDWQDSLFLCEKALKVDPHNEDLYILRASNLSFLGRPTDGHQLLHERISQKPHSSKLNLALIDWHRKFGSQKAAIEVAKKMIFRAPEQLEAHKVIAELSIDQKDYLTAESSLSVVFENDKQDETNAYQYAQLLLQLGKTNDAEQAFKQAYGGKKHKLDAAKYLAWINADRGNIKASNYYLRELSVHNQDDAFIRKIITRNLLNSPDVDRITLMTSYLKEQKDDWGQYQLYLAYVDGGLQERAMDLLAEIWNSSPDKYWAGINYAHHLNLVGDEKYANSLLETISQKPLTNQDKNLIAELRQKWESPDYKKTFRAIATTTKKHKVLKGDSMSEISEKYLGSSYRWKEIQKINKKVVKEDGHIFEGSELQLPGNTP